MRFSPHGIAFGNGGDGRVTDLYLTDPTNIVCKGEAVDENMKWREQTVKKPARLQVSEGRIV